MAAAATAAGLVMALSVPAGAQTYSDGTGNDTGVQTDTNTDGDTTTTTDGGTTSTDGSTDGGGTGTAGDLAQVDDGELAFTGGDAIGLAVIGGSAVAAGAAMVVVGRRRDED